MASSGRESKRAKRSPKHDERAEAEAAGSDTEEDDLALLMHADGTDDGDEEESHAGGDKDDTVNVDFALFDPQEVDFLSLKRFLKVLLPGNDARFAEGASALASDIIAQPSVGTMVKVGEDVDVWAFATALPWTAAGQTAYRREMTRFLLAKCPDDGADAPAGDLGAGSRRVRLQRVLDGDKGPVSLLLSERMLNFPPELAPAIFASLLEDLKWARDQRGGGDASLEPDWFLLLAPCFKDPKTGDVHHLHFEDEILHAAAVLSFDVNGPVPEAPAAGAASGGAAAAASSSSSSAEPADEGADGPSGAAAQQVRRVFVFPAAALAGAAESMTKMVVSAREMEAAAHSAAKGSRKRSAEDR